MVRSSIKKRKPWIIFLCVLIALVMVLPLYEVINVVGDMRNPDSTAPAANGSVDPLERLQEEALRLEQYIAEYEATPAVLKELSTVYMQINNYISSDESDDTYLQKAVTAMEEAVELEPEEIENYLLLLDLYSKTGNFEKATETSYRAQEMLLDKLEENPGDNLSRLYYSRLLAGYRFDYESAIENLNIILNSETEGSELYNLASEDKEMFSELITDDNIIEMETEAENQETGGE